MDTDADIWSSQDDFDTDPTLVTEYQAEIFAYKKELEIIHLPDPNYMSRQHDLSWNYRVQLIDWIIQVHDRFDLLQETMHLCVNYLDRFLSRVVIPVDQLQLAGTVALLLASKYEEIQSPAIEVLSHLGGDVHAPARIREAEIGMLKALNYDMGAPGPMSFLRRISRADNYDVDIRTLAKYLIDVTLCDHRFIGFPSSMIAAVGYCASMRLLFRGEWTAQHVHYSGYTEPMLATGINMLLVMLEQPTQTHQALFKKYNDERYMHSSQYVHGLGHSILRSLHSKILAH
ncbi:cyclin-like protein [Lobosporangium transversale]|uniref:Cyclin-like protein n=1 Tax=Lobosporangium transversale TaxID=64571 RepID=A0A1Y2GMB2_9FUNG|nr:cyclin-like protein [Lobosporangium transversale]ORZ15436.1 cyclin-like protein [Lobosporangium transversale]|eukprot:XP_021881184.1 cyclin-like protein [Lobosporangium transversale]